MSKYLSIHDVTFVCNIAVSRNTYNASEQLYLHFLPFSPLAVINI